MPQACLPMGVARAGGGVAPPVTMMITREKFNETTEPRGVSFVIIVIPTKATVVIITELVKILGEANVGTTMAEEDNSMEMSSEKTEGSTTTTEILLTMIANFMVHFNLSCRMEVEVTDGKSEKSSELY